MTVDCISRSRSSISVLGLAEGRLTRPWKALKRTAYRCFIAAT